MAFPLLAFAGLNLVGVLILLIIIVIVLRVL